jgi:hypothetical protein
MRMRHIVIRGLSGSTIFFHFISQTAPVSIIKLTYFFLFSPQILSETFLVLGRIHRDKVKKAKGCKAGFIQHCSSLKPIVLSPLV